MFLAIQGPGASLEVFLLCNQVKPHQEIAPWQKEMRKASTLFIKQRENATFLLGSFLLTRDDRHISWVLPHHSAPQRLPYLFIEENVLQEGGPLARRLSGLDKLVQNMGLDHEAINWSSGQEGISCHCNRGRHRSLQVRHHKSHHTLINGPAMQFE